MKRDRLTPLYDRLAPDERLRLVIESLARGDETDAQHLSKACPQRSYVENNRAFSDPLRASLRLTERVVLSLIPLLVKLDMLEAMSSLLDMALESAADQTEIAYKLGRLDAGGTKAATEEDESLQSVTRELRRPILKAQERIGEDLSAARAEVTANATSLFQAFEHVCLAEIGVVPEKLLRAYFEPFVDALRLKELSEGEADLDLVEERQTVLTQAWRHATDGVAG